jgi:hypothetical protein
MEIVDRIKRGAGGNGMVREPDRIKSLKLGSAPTTPAEPPAGGVDSTPAADA